MSSRSQGVESPNKGEVVDNRDIITARRGFIIYRFALFLKCKNIRMQCERLFYICVKNHLLN